MKHVLVVQARMGSTRLPGKVLQRITGRAMLEHVLERARRIPGLDAAILTLYDRPEDAVLAQFGEQYGYDVDIARGVKVGDVLGRYIHATRDFDEDTAIIRVTADCPLFDPMVCANGLRIGIDALTMGTNSPVEETGWFDGLDYEVIPLTVLRQADREATDPEDRAHVTRWIRRHLFQIGYLSPTESERALLDAVPVHSRKWSVDTAEDLRLVRMVYAADAQTDWKTTATFLAYGER